MSDVLLGYARRRGFFNGLEQKLDDGLIFRSIFVDEKTLEDAGAELKEEGADVPVVVQKEGTKVQSASLEALQVELSKRRRKVSSDERKLLCLHLNNVKHRILCADLSADRRRLVYGAENGDILLRNLSNPDEHRIAVLSGGGSVFCARFLKNTPRGFFLTGSEDGAIRLWASDQRLVVRTYSEFNFPTFALDVDPDDQFFVAASFDGSARLFNYDAQVSVRVFAGHSDAVQCVSFLHGLGPGGVRPLVATASADKTVRLWSQEQAVPVRVFHTNRTFPTCLGFDASAQTLVIGSADGHLTVVDVRNDKIKETFEFDDSIANALDFDDVGSLVAAGSSGRVKLYEKNENGLFSGGKSRQFVVSDDAEVLCVQSSPSGLFCVSFRQV